MKRLGMDFLSKLRRGKGKAAAQLSAQLAARNQRRIANLDLIELLIKREGLHEGHWSLMVEFGMGAQYFGAPDGKAFPGASIMVTTIGIQRQETPGPAGSEHTVDAAAVNPAPSDPPQAA